MGVNYDTIDRFVLGSEAKLGRMGFAALVGLGMLLLGAIYVRPEFNYIGAGVHFEQLARNPFDFSQTNPLGYRILTPLISYLLGLRGKLFIITNLVIAAIFIATVYYTFRQTAPRPGDALMGTFILAFSTVVLVTIGQSGWCDILTYLAIFAMWRWRRNGWLFVLFFAVALFNHESVVFLTPWLLWVRLKETGWNSRRAVLTMFGLAALAVAYWFFRTWIGEQRAVTLSAVYYFQPLIDDPFKWMRQPFPYYWLGWFTVFKVLWIIPIVAFWQLWKQGQRREALFLALPTVLAATQLLIAWDSTRMLTLGYMTMVLALLYFFKTSAVEIRRWLPGLVLFNLLVPQLYTASTVIEIMHSTPMNLLRMWLQGKPWWP